MKSHFRQMFSQSNCALHSFECVGSHFHLAVFTKHCAFIKRDAHWRLIIRPHVLVKSCIMYYQHGSFHLSHVAFLPCRLHLCWFKKEQPNTSMFQMSTGWCRTVLFHLWFTVIEAFSFPNFFFWRLRMNFISYKRFTADIEIMTWRV